MALLHTPGFDEDLHAPEFHLKNVDGRMLSYNDVRGERGTVVAFICNHCPYVHAIIQRFVETAKALQNQGIGVVAIMPNDTDTRRIALKTCKCLRRKMGLAFRM